MEKYVSFAYVVTESFIYKYFEIMQSSRFIDIYSF